MKPFSRVLAAAVFAWNAALAAEPYPVRPVTYVTVFAPGSGPEVLQRRVTEVLSRHLGQKVLLDHRVGASGALAAQAVARAKPDGYTVLSGTEALLILKHMQPAVGYDPIADFVPVSRLGHVPLVLLTHPKSGPASVEELIARIRSAPGKLNYGSSGVGNLLHLMAAAFLGVAGLDAVHVPFKGGIESNRALIRGDVEFVFAPLSGALPLVHAKQMRPVAVTSEARVPQLPDVPALREIVRSDLLVQESWGGLWAPAGTPAEIVARLHAALSQTLSDPVLLKDAEASSGATAAPSASPAEFAAFLRRENEKWREIVKRTGVRAD